MGDLHDDLSIQTMNRVSQLFQPIDKLISVNSKLPEMGLPVLPNISVARDYKPHTSFRQLLYMVNKLGSRCAILRRHRLPGSRSHEAILYLYILYLHADSEQLREVEKGVILF